METGSEGWDRPLPARAGGELSKRRRREEAGQPEARGEGEHSPEREAGAGSSRGLRERTAPVPGRRAQAGPSFAQALTSGPQGTR